MANHGYGISLPKLSQTSGDESSEHCSHSLASLSKGTSYIYGSSSTSASIANNKNLPTSLAQVGGGGDIGDNINDHHKIFLTPKKPRGRPRGSKNKPKPPDMISKEDDQAMKLVVIEISTGSDVVEELIQFAQRHKVGLTVLSGSGIVTNISLHNPFSQVPSLTVHGTFTLLSLSGTYISNPIASHPISSSSPLPNPSSAIPWAGCSSFAVCLAGTQGQVFGGVITGKILAASLVVVVATLYKNPTLHRLPNNEGGDNVVDLSSIENARNANAPKASMNNNVKAMSAAFNVANPTPLSFHVLADANVNVMQWGQPSHSLNYKG